MSFPDHFSAVAAQYAAYRPHYPRELVDALASLTEPPELAWDVGCGSGQLSVALAERFARVIATDPSAKQVAAATPHARVEYRCEPAEASTLAAASADLVVAAQAAHWFDWPRFCAEVERVAKPGALVALVSYNTLHVAGDAGAELAHYYRDVAGPYWPPERAHVENGYRDLVLPWPPVEACPRRAPWTEGKGEGKRASERASRDTENAPPIAMTADWTRDELVGYVTTWSATAGLVKRHGTAAFDGFVTRLCATWPADERRQVRWPLTLRLARR